MDGDLLLTVTSLLMLPAFRVMLLEMAQAEQDPAKRERLQRIARLLVRTAEESQ